MKKSGLLGIVVAVGLEAGCMMGPNYKRPAVNVPTDYRAAAPDPVAPDGVSQGLFDAPSEPAELQTIDPKKNGELAARPAPPLFVYRVVFGLMNQATSTRKTESGIRRA